MCQPHRTYGLHTAQATEEGIGRIRQRMAELSKPRDPDRRGWTYEDLAERAGISLTTVKRFLNGNRIRMDFMSYIAEALGLSLQDIEISEILEPRPGYLEGPVPLNSPFYIERPPIESDCYREITGYGALIRIKAPMQSGKTSLLNRILQNAATSGYRIVSLNLRMAVLTNPDIFLHWFYANVCQRLGITVIPGDDWNEQVPGSEESCRSYFQSYILEPLDSPLVLGLDNVDRVFDYPDIAEKFLTLLRYWREQAIEDDVWHKLRLVIAHSTEVYIHLDINQSPFNIGLPVRLPPFTEEQIRNLVQQYGLNCCIGDREVRRLREMVGGHPFLSQLTLYHLWHRDVTLDRLLQEAPTQAGIYSAHLLRLLEQLQQQPELAAGMTRVVTAATGVSLEPMQAYILESMGLVHLLGNECFPSCELYRQYFRSHL